MSELKEALKAYALTSDEEYERQKKAERECWDAWKNLFYHLNAGRGRSHSINYHAIRKNREEVSQERDEL